MKKLHLQLVGAHLKGQIVSFRGNFKADVLVQIPLKGQSGANMDIHGMEFVFLDGILGDYNPEIPHYPLIH